LTTPPRQLSYAQTARRVGLKPMVQPRTVPYGPLPPANNSWWVGKDPGKLKKCRAGVITTLMEYGHYVDGKLEVLPPYPYSGAFHEYHASQPLVSLHDRSRSALYFKKKTKEAGGAYFLGNTQGAVRFLRKAFHTYELLREGLYGALREDYTLSGNSVRVYREALRAIRPDVPQCKWYCHLNFCFRKLCSRDKMLLR